MIRPVVFAALGLLLAVMVGLTQPMDLMRALVVGAASGYIVPLLLRLALALRRR